MKRSSLVFDFDLERGYSGSTLELPALGKIQSSFFVVQEGKDDNVTSSKQQPQNSTYTRQSDEVPRHKLSAQRSP
jgi:hypothetical protein